MRNGEAAVTLGHSTAALLGLAPTGGQLGFLLSLLLAFALGWTCKAIRDKRRADWRQRAFFRGERVGR